MRRRSSRGRPADHIGDSLQSSLSVIDRYIKKQQIDDALELLNSLNQRYPNRVEILGRLLQIYSDIGDMQSYVIVAEQLHRLQPNDPQLSLVLASGYMMTDQEGLAYRTFTDFVTRWPNHEEAAQVREQMDKLIPLLEFNWQSFGSNTPLNIADLVEYDEIQSLFLRRDFRTMIKRGEQLIARYPTCSPLRNNIGSSYYQLGLHSDALAIVHKVLTYDPDNLFALCNLALWNTLLGTDADVPEYLARIRALPLTDPLVASKKAEILSAMGDSEGVLQVFDRFQKFKDRDLIPELSAFVYHLAAVAAQRVGRTQAARKRWHKALELDPNQHFAEDNLADLEEDPNVRNGPWAFDATYWIPQYLISEILQTFNATKDPSDEALQRNIQRLIKNQPQLRHVIPKILAQGDPEGREMVFMLAMMAKTPEMDAILRDFGLGKDGPLGHRIEAVKAAQQAGLIPSGLVRMWQGGDWRELIIIGFEIHDDVVGSYHPQVQQLITSSVEASHRNDPKTSEQHLLKAIELHKSLGNGDDLTMLNNLAAAYGMQGRKDEAHAITERIFAQDPDYLFGRTNMASLLTSQGKYQEAQELLNPLFARTSIHISEFNALLSSQVQLHIAQDNLEAAQTWIGMWEEVDPDSRNLRYLSRQVALMGLRRRRR